MARIHNVSECDAGELRLRIRPRDDVLVLEVPDGPAPPDRATPPDGATLADRAMPPDGAALPDDGTGHLPAQGDVVLGAAHGPFRHYRRTVHWQRAAPDRFEVHQTVEFTPAIPYFAPLYLPLLRRALVRGPRPGTVPWWSTPDRLSSRQSTVVATMAVFNLTAGLLYGLLTQVLTFIAADLGEGTRSEQTTLLAVARLGVVVTMVAMVVADRRGRRLVAVWSFAAAGVLTVLTALAPSYWAVGALQLVARNLAIAGLLCVDTIAVEELPPGSRAMVTGLGTLAYGLGAGVVVMTLPLADLGPWGWRLTFVVGGLTLPLIWHAMRHLPESARFERHRLERAARRQATGTHAATGEAPAGADVATPVESRRIHGGRFLLLAAMFFLLNVFVAPSSQLQNDYLRTEHLFSGALISLFVLATSTPGGLGVVVGGRLADVRGRRAAIVPGLLAVGVFNALFFSVGGAWMWVASLLGSVIGALAVPAMGVIAPELFPTAHRGGVRGALTGIAVGGSVCGLLLAGWLVDTRSYAYAFVLLAGAPVLAAALAFAIPETRGRELEDLNR